MSDTSTTETTTTTTGAGGQADTQPATTVDNGDVQPGNAGDSEPAGNGEAARYRRQLRETEGQRDALAERLAGYQKREARPSWLRFSTCPPICGTWQGSTWPAFTTTTAPSTKTRCGSRPAPLPKCGPG